MNSVVSLLSLFVFAFHLVTNPWRLRDIVQVSFCFILVCVAGRFTISKGVFLNLEEYKWRRGRKKARRGGSSVFWRQEVAPPEGRLHRRGRWDGWYKCHQRWVLQNSSMSCLGNRALENEVSIKSGGGWYSFAPVSPCFLKGFRKEPFVFFSRKVTLKFICVELPGSIVSFTGSCRLHRTMLLNS